MSATVDKRNDVDPEETAEWLESYDDLVRARGRERARQILDDLNARAGRAATAACLAVRRGDGAGCPFLRDLDPCRRHPPGDGAPARHSDAR